MFNIGCRDANAEHRQPLAFSLKKQFPLILSSKNKLVKD